MLALGGERRRPVRATGLAARVGIDGHPALLIGFLIGHRGPLAACARNLLRHVCRGRRLPGLLGGRPVGRRL
eukprot:15448600-Alexandrium_andersonii.AAC.1